MKYCCLIGNGASVAYNNQLAMGALYAHLRDEFDAAGDDLLTALAAYVAENVGEDEGDNFEQLLGPLEWAGSALSFLEPLAQSFGDDPPQQIQGLRDTARLLRRLRRTGLAITLGRIADAARGEGEQDHERVVVALAEALIELGGDDAPGDVTVATLNYDGLLHSGWLRDPWKDKVVDLAAGYDEAQHRLVDGQPQLTGQKLRGTLNLHRDRLWILQLHGSLAWLKQPRTDRVWRFVLNDLRNLHGHGYWTCLRQGHTDWAPVAVLTDRKTRTVDDWPFALAYDGFARRLRGSTRWLVAGYGFGDAPVNTAISQSFQSHPDGADVKLLVLGNSGTEAELQARASEALGIPGDQIDATVAGILDAVGAQEWNDWAA